MYKKYYYNCDNINDIGWGCGWRCIQNVISRFSNKYVSLPEIKKYLENNNFKFPNNVNNYGFIDGKMIEFYLKKYYKVYEYNIYKIEELYNLLKIFNNQNNTGILIHDGYIVNFDRVDDMNIYIIDPHVYKNDFSSLKNIGYGGEGWMNIIDILYKNVDIIPSITKEEFLKNNTPTIYLIENTIV